MSVNILGIGTACPPNRFSQAEILQFMASAHQLSGKPADRLKALYRASGIKFRHSVLSDYGKRPENFEFYPKSEVLAPFPSITHRMQRYRKEAVPLCLAAVRNLEMVAQLPEAWEQTVTHLVTVSCTGMYAPGIDLDLIGALQLSASTQRTAINFMGCYGAFNALKVADAVCRADPSAKVLVVCVELCTLHFQNKNDGDNLLANALFADGAAAVLLSAQKNSRPSLSMLGFHCGIEPTGAEDMAWTIGDFGFEMKLSSYVPDLIKANIRRLAGDLLKKYGFEEHFPDYYAIHPGGKRILEAVEEALSISKAKNTAAYDVLREYGNMSSPTVLFVLQRLMRSFGPSDHGKKVLSFAFGPGLTLESMLLEINDHSDA